MHRQALPVRSKEKGFNAEITEGTEGKKRMGITEMLHSDLSFSQRFSL
jgi:hypothetical protein